MAGSRKISESVLSTAHSDASKARVASTPLASAVTISAAPPVARSPTVTCPPLRSMRRCTSEAAFSAAPRTTSRALAEPSAAEW